MSKVLFLGAGASVDADYPITAKLMDEIEQRFHNSRMVNDQQNWAAFDSFRQNVTGALATILQSSNPELILTVPDLLEATLKEADQDNWRQLKNAADCNDVDAAAAINAWWNHPDREALHQGYLAKLAFQRVTDSFFSHNHARDSYDGQRSKRDYLHTAFASLEPGDTVITTNWDTLAERTLMEADKWLPTDGCGFPVAIETSTSLRLREPPTLLTGRAQVKVLKIHGSIGWFRRSDDGGIADFYLRDSRFLQYLTPPGVPGRIRDRNCPPRGDGPDQNPIIIVPSYLKQLDNSVLQSIWDQAATALNNADEVTFVGYSLPSADIAIRVLINPLRQRLAHGDIKVCVVDPNKAVLERWKSFLSGRINVISKTAKMFYAGECR